MGWKDKETVSVASVSWCHFFNGPWPQGAISAPGTRAKKKILRIWSCYYIVRSVFYTGYGNMLKIPKRGLYQKMKGLNLIYWQKFPREKICEVFKFGRYLYS